MNEVFAEVLRVKKLGLPKYQICQLQKRLDSQMWQFADLLFGISNGGQSANKFRKGSII
jgi:hypothetical protein